MRDRRSRVAPSLRTIDEQDADVLLAAEGLDAVCKAAGVGRICQAEAGRLEKHRALASGAEHGNPEVCIAAQCEVDG